MFEAASTIMAFVALYGTYLNANQKKKCFYFWLVTNAFFSLESASAGLYAQSLLFMAYFFLAIKGIYTWKE